MTESVPTGASVGVTLTFVGLGSDTDDYAGTIDLVPSDDKVANGETLRMGSGPFTGGATRIRSR